MPKDGPHWAIVVCFRKPRLYSGCLLFCPMRLQWGEADMILLGLERFHLKGRWYEHSTMREALLES